MSWKLHGWVSKDEHFFFWGKNSLDETKTHRLAFYFEKQQQQQQQLVLPISALQCTNIDQVVEWLTAQGK